MELSGNGVDLEPFVKSLGELFGLTVNIVAMPVDGKSLTQQYLDAIKQEVLKIDGNVKDRYAGLTNYMGSGLDS